MKLSNHSLRNLIKEELEMVLSESQFQDPLAGKIAFTICLFVKLLFLKSNIEEYYKNLDSGKTKAEPDPDYLFDKEVVFNPDFFGVDSSEGKAVLALNRTFSINFIDSTQEAIMQKLTLDIGEPAFKDAQGEIARSKYVKKVYIRFLNEAVSHYNSEVEKIKRNIKEVTGMIIANSKDTQKGSKKRRTKINIETFSGNYKINIKLHQGLDTIEAEGGAYHPEAKVLTQNLSVPVDYFNVFQPNKNLKDFGKAFQQSVVDVKKTVSHELIHVTQTHTEKESGFVDKAIELINPVRAQMRSNYNPFLSKIDEKQFPVVSKFQDYLEGIVKSKFFIYSTKKDLMNVKLGLGEAKEAATAFRLAELLAKVFAPKEEEAFVRGFYSKVKKQKSWRGTGEAVEEEMRNHFRMLLDGDEYIRMFSKKHANKVKQFLNSSIDDAVQGMMQEYYKIFGKQTS